MQKTDVSTAQGDTGSPSFVTGFGLGLLAGAAGFVLFGTKKGEALRRDLQKAFAEAYKEEIAAGQVTGEAISLRDFLATAVSKVKEELDLDAHQAKKLKDLTEKRRSKSKRSKPKSANAKTKFKGT